MECEDALRECEARRRVAAERVREAVEGALSGLAKPLAAVMETWAAMGCAVADRLGMIADAPRQAEGGLEMEYKDAVRECEAAIREAVSRYRDAAERIREGIREEDGASAEPVRQLAEAMEFRADRERGTADTLGFIATLDDPAQPAVWEAEVRIK